MKPRSLPVAAAIALLVCPLLASMAEAAAPIPVVDSPPAFERARAELPRQSVHFEAGEALVDDEQSAVVIDAVHLAQDFPHDLLRIAGHADPHEGDRTLAQRRADAVKRQFMLLGIPAERIEVVGASGDAACGDEHRCAEQRRADIEHVWR